MCIYENSPDARLEAIRTFAQVCYKAGRKVKDWRKEIDQRMCIFILL